MRALLLASFFVSLSALAIACSSKHDDAAPAAPEPPPRICRTPGAPPPKWFTEVTNDVGLGATASFEPVATSVVSADFDGDGWPDLLLLRGESTRGLVMGKRVRFLMMNRPDPNDPGKRIFVDVPDQAGLLATRDGMGNRGASLPLVGDFDDDGDVDVMTCPSDFTTNDMMLDACAAFLNDGHGNFTLAPPSDVDKTIYPATSAVLFDYDRDGVLDFWPAGMANWTYPGPGQSWDNPQRLFRGNGDGTFTEVTRAVGLPTKEGSDEDGTSFRRTFGITTCDIDGDGDQDVITASYGREENQVWRNDDGKFTNVAHALGLDHDDREDFTDDESYRCWCSVKKTCTPMPPAPIVPCNAFGGPYFRGWIPGVSDKSYSLGGNNFGVACVDVDDDGDMDVLFAEVAHGDVGQSSDPTEIAFNPGGGGKFTRPGPDALGLARAHASKLWDQGDNEPAFADVDLDGRKDLFLTSTVYPASRPWLFHQKPDGSFEEIGIPAGIVKQKGSSMGYPVFSPIAQGVDFVDYDGDGDLDLIVGASEGDDPVRVFRNDVGQDSNFLRVKLVGGGVGAANTAAIGARVRVTSGGRTQTLEVKGGEGIGNIQNDFVLTFGLGASCDDVHVEVRWPDATGTTATYDGVRVNYTVLINQGDTTVTYR